MTATNPFGATTPFYLHNQILKVFDNSASASLFYTFFLTFRRSTAVSKGIEMEALTSFYDFITETGDARTATMPFIKSPKYVVGAVLLYLLMVIFGPRIMEKRQPFQLRNVLIGYNFFSVVFSAWMTWEVLFYPCKHNVVLTSIQHP